VEQAPGHAAPLSLIHSLGAPCGNIDPLGITSTPVVDAAANEVFVAAEVRVGSSTVAHQLFGINLTSGAMIVNGAGLDPPGITVAAHQQRAALALGNGRVYVGFGGLAGDCGQYNGWIVSLLENGTGFVSFRVPTAREGAIWGTSGPAVDVTGNVYVSTGNGSQTNPAGPYDGSDSVIKLTPTLQELSLFAPSSWASENANDLDLGSVGPALVGNGLVFQVGKQQTGYLLNTANLGGIGGAIAGHQVCFADGGTAYVDPFIYVPCADGIRAVKLLPGPDFTVAWHTPASANGPPIVALGLVWSLDTNNGILYGLDPSNGTVRFQAAVGAVQHFATPTAAGDLLLVPTATGVQAFRNQPCFIAAPKPSVDALAVVRSAGWYFRSTISPGKAEGVDCYGEAGDRPVIGDWDGNGSTTPGVFRNGVWYSSNSFLSPSADVTVPFGDPGDVPVVGDWTGSGKSSIGVFRGGIWYLDITPHRGAADLTFAFGDPSDIPVTGQWIGGLKSSVGVFRHGAWYFANTLHGGFADTAIAFGNPTDVPVAGDWANSGKSTPGVFRDGVWYLTTSFHSGGADISVAFGGPGDAPLHWH
jgi:hypothetical protein